MKRVFFGIVDEDNNLIYHTISSSGDHLIYQRASAMSVSFFNYESDAINVMDICEKERPNSTFTIKRFEY